MKTKLKNFLEFYARYLDARNKFWFNLINHSKGMGVFKILYKLTVIKKYLFGFF